MSRLELSFRGGFDGCSAALLPALFKFGRFGFGSGTVVLEMGRIYCPGWNGTAGVPLMGEALP